VSELVGNDGCGQIKCEANLMQVISQLMDERVLAAVTSKQALVWWPWIERAKEAQAMNEVTREGVDGDHTFGLELAEGDLNGPCAGSGRTKAIKGEIGTLADAHAGVAQ
jgi:hypothetical protein